jgi:hypothetical protein
MRDALARARAAAEAGEPLSMSLLKSWQRVVLGRDHDPPFRTTDAFAKLGRERYAIGPGVAEAFEVCLNEANAGTPHAAGRAARVYLDLCFFHPFDDGNARAARLALDYVITRAGLALVTAEPVFSFARWADDEPGASNLSFLIARMIAVRAVVI